MDPSIEIARAAADTDSDERLREARGMLKEIGALGEGPQSIESLSRRTALIKALSELFRSPLEERCLDFIERAGEGNRFEIGSALAGMNGERAWKLREALLAEGFGGPVCEGLAGLGSQRAWEMRDRIAASGKFDAMSVVSLIGLGDDRAFEAREKAIEPSIPKGYLGFVAWSLAGLDSERAWALRDRLRSSPIHPAHPDAKLDIQYLGRGLASLDSDRAWELRDELLAAKIPAGWILEGLSGLDSERAWQMREQFFSKKHGLDYVALGLAGLGNERAWEMRDRLLSYRPSKGSGSGLSHNYYAQGLAGCYCERAWQERERLLEEGAQPKFLLAGVKGGWMTAAIGAARKGL